MVDIKVGEYVRTQTGRIGKVISTYKDYWLKTTLDRGYYLHSMSEFKKHSKNLIDLIEDGDIIELDDFHRDRYQVMEIHGVLSIYVIESDNYEGIGNFEIRRILTKEQYTANCYKVGEKDEASND